MDVKDGFEVQKYLHQILASFFGILGTRSAPLNSSVCVIFSHMSENKRKKCKGIPRWCMQEPSVYR